MGSDLDRDKDFRLVSFEADRTRTAHAAVARPHARSPDTGLRRSRQLAGEKKRALGWFDEAQKLARFDAYGGSHVQ